MAVDSSSNAPKDPSPSTEGESQDFLREIVARDNASGRYSGRVVTRFPPEPNGYLHIGHAKAICIDFGLAKENGGECHLRMDDTNPTTEDEEFVRSIQNDIRWLGFDWDGHLYYASDYFEKLYEFAVKLINDGKAYVCSLSEEEVREYRGTVTEAGKPSPYRDRTVEENLDLFARMRKGEFEDGEHTLRAKIDMAASNMKMRDPPLYRIRHAHHYRTGNDWPIYPMYDFAHCLSDVLERVTHSICTLEFENNRELYDWIVENAFGTEEAPKQYEFARLNLSYTVMSKRKLLQLVRDGHVRGWDDPRMPSLAGLRRRGVPPAAIRDLCDSVGVAKANSTVDIAQFEYHIREALNHEAPRVLAVLNPLKVVVTNYPEDKEEQLDASYWPHDVPKEGSRKLPFSKELYIERDDFMENPPKKFFRLAPGREVRLRYSYVLRCDEVIKDDTGEVRELRCSIDPDTLGANPADGRKIKGTIHWVSAEHALRAEVRLYDRLFAEEKPDAGEGTFLDHLNPSSLETVIAFVEPSLADVSAGEAFQFERHGYFAVDSDSAKGALVFNRTVPLRDSWGKIASKATPTPKDVPKKKTPKGEAKMSKPKEAPTRSAEEQECWDAFRSMGVPEDDADVLATHPALLEWTRAATASGGSAAGVSKWITNELLAVLKERSLGDLAFGGKELGEMVALLEKDVISSKGAKKVFAVLLEKGGVPADIVKAEGLEQVSDASAIEGTVDAVLADHPETIEKYRSGKTNVLGFLVGQVMKRSGGKANPGMVSQLLTKKLEG